MTPKNWKTVLIVCVAALCVAASNWGTGSGSAFGSERKTASESKTFRAVSSRDARFSSARGEELGNGGGSPRLKAKGYQEFSLLDFDVSPLRGKRIESATLTLTLCGDERLERVGLSSIVAAWTEGKDGGYEPEPGASSFRWRANPDVPWVGRRGDPAYSDATAVIFGEGGSCWTSVDASEPVDGKQKIDVDSRLISLMANGLSEGLVVFDDTGTELRRSGENGEDVEIRLFPNRFFFSRDQNAGVAPTLEVVYSEDLANGVSPSAPTGLRVETDDEPEGNARLYWTYERVERDRIVAFEIAVDGEPLDRTTVPAPRIDEPLDAQTFETRLVGLDASKERIVKIRSINDVGMKSGVAELRFRPSTRRFASWAEILGTDGKGGTSEAKRADVSRPAKTTDVAVLNEFDKLDENGNVVPQIQADYRLKNAVWDAGRRAIDLAAAKNEFVGFQLLVPGTKKRRVRLELDWNSSDFRPETAFYRLERVETPEGKFGDPAIRLENGETIIDGSETIYVETFVPKTALRGEYAGTLRLIDGGQTTTLAVRLRVWNFALPDKLSFLPEMNCYSLPENERDYYRLAQRHRTYINRVPYSHRGTVTPGLAPTWDATARRFDWRDWDRRFGPLLDGSAFDDSPRGATPVEAFYLPIFENFPANVFDSYNENVWPDKGFDEEYKKTFRAACRDAAEHFAEKGWNDIRFFFFLNNKMDYKRNGWSKASSPWLLDEPASYRDFSALKFFGELMKEGVSDVDGSGGSRSILFRADISRPQWARNSLDSSLDVEVVSGGAFATYADLVNRRRERFGRLLYLYGTTAAPEKNGWQPVFWSLDAWSRGADGIVPWQTIGTEDSWRRGDELALFYPPTESTKGEVVPSIRLKAYRRGEQDVEYLTLLQRKTGRPRTEIAAAFRARFPLSATNRSVSAEDAGTTFYESASPDDLERLRREIGRFLDASTGF